METFDYSIEAKNVINFFHGVDKIVYVEGDDDIPFWEIIFEKLANFSVVIEEVGGKNELDKHIAQIESEEVNFIVAKDSDYEEITRKKAITNVITTYGYSIENSIITKDSLLNLIRTICKIPKREIPEELCENWLEQLNNKTKPLVIFDIISQLEEWSIEIIPNNSDRFMKSKRSCILCSTKIGDYLSDKNKVVTEDKKQEIDKNISECGFCTIDILQGHFLLSATLRFIKDSTRSLKSEISISKEMLFSNLLTSFALHMNEAHPHYAHYKEQVDSIKI